MSGGMSFDIPSGRVLPVDAVDVRLEPGPHPLERENAQAIEANWQREVAEQPALFNGTVVLLSQLSYSARQLVGVCHPVSYAAFLYWRRHREQPAAHFFAHPMLVSRDGALIAARMASTTANAGRVYFPAGMFEPQDFSGGRVDLHANMVREVREETGIDLGAARFEQGWHALAGDAGTVIFGRYLLDRDADALAVGHREISLRARTTRRSRGRWSSAAPTTSPRD